MLYAPYIRYFPFSLHILTPEHSMQKNNNIRQKTHLHIECLPKQASCFGWLPHHLPNEGHISKIKFIISLWKQLTEVTSQVTQTVIVCYMSNWMIIGSFKVEKILRFLPKAQFKKNLVTKFLQFRHHGEYSQTCGNVWILVQSCPLGYISKKKKNWHAHTAILKMYNQQGSTI